MKEIEDQVKLVQERLDDVMETLRGTTNDTALLPAARNAIVSVGGLARYGAPIALMHEVVNRVAKAVARFLDRDPGDALGHPLVEQRAATLAAVIEKHGDLDKLEEDERRDWEEQAYELLAERDGADAWMIGSAGVMRRLELTEHRENFYRVRERQVALIERFDRALDPALPGLTSLRDAARKALRLARSDKGHMRRAHYWFRIIEG